MMQRVGSGLFVGMMLAVAVSCGGTEPATSNAGAPSTGAMAGTPATSPPTAGTAASAGSKATTSSGTAGSTGTTMSGVSSAAGSKAAAGAGGTPAATAAGSGGAPAAAGATGSAGTSAAAGKGGAAGMTGATAAAGGGAASGGCGTESFKAIYDSILKNPTYNCTGALCHGREAAMATTVGNLSMSTAAVAYMQLVKASSTSMACSGKTRVVPHDAAGSLLVQKLRGATTMCGGVMPVGADEIPEADFKRISDWIAGGACDN